MFKVNYYEEEKVKDLIYDEAYIKACENNNTHWMNYYGYLKDKYDLTYNVESVTIDMVDIEKMKFDIYSNGILKKLFDECKKDHSLFKEHNFTIVNDNKLAEEIIYNIMKAEWLIDERLVDPYNPELPGRENYFKALLSVSEDSTDIKTQFRNKLLEHFIRSYHKAKREREEKVKVLYK